MISDEQILSTVRKLVDAHLPSEEQRTAAQDRFFAAMKEQSSTQPQVAAKVQSMADLLPALRYSYTADLGKNSNVGDDSIAGLIAIESKGNFVSSPGKLVALLGVQGLVVIETEDTILVTTRERVPEIMKALTESESAESYFAKFRESQGPSPSAVKNPPPVFVPKKI